MKYIVNPRKIIKWVLLGGLLIVVFGVVFSGHSKKSYDHVMPNDSLAISGVEMSIGEWAGRYAPVVTKDVFGEPPDWLWYEAALSADTLKIAYFPSWKTEHHPVRVLDILYSSWRFLYYGSARDIEFISLSIRLDDGAVFRAEFESPELLQFGMVKHVKSVLTEGDERLEFIGPFRKDNGLITTFNPSSWNHLFDVKTTEFDQVIAQPSALTFLDENTFVRYKMTRRSKPLWMD